jgi:hypothetical protein
MLCSPHEAGNGPVLPREGPCDVHVERGSIHEGETLRCSEYRTGESKSEKTVVNRHQTTEFSIHFCSVGCAVGERRGRKKAYGEGEVFTGPSKCALWRWYMEENEDGWNGKVTELEQARWDEDHDGAHLRA